MTLMALLAFLIFKANLVTLWRCPILEFKELGRLLPPTPCINLGLSGSVLYLSCLDCGGG